MRYEYSDDLFEDSKMTFGQHLEELRGSLFKAIVALVAGFLVGLLVGGYIVEWVEIPLKTELQAHYRAIAETKYDQYVAERTQAKQPVLYTFDQFKVFLDSGYSYNEFLVDPRDLIAQLREKHPELFRDGAPPFIAADDRISPDDFILLRAYYRSEDDPRAILIATKVEEPFMVYVKAALVFGAVLASPAIFYYIWNFVAAGLYPHEKRYVYIYLPFSLSLFLAGAALAYFFAIHYVLIFLFKFNDWLGVDPQPKVAEWLGFVLLLPLGFGVAFQLPLVMLFLERIGVFSVQLYKDKWRISVLVISILSMVLTPSDPQSMLLMFIPLTILYFGGIALCRFMPRARVSPFGEPID